MWQESPPAGVVSHIHDSVCRAGAAVTDGCSESAGHSMTNVFESESGSKPSPPEGSSLVATKV